MSIGSGECEHEVPFFLAGYQIIGSDIAAEALGPVRALFPGFRTILFDILGPAQYIECEDVPITGLDYCCDRAMLDTVFRNVHALLKPGGRFLFTLRHNANVLTLLIDYLGMPLLWLALTLYHLARRSGYRYRLMWHGYRRSRRAIATLGARHGFRLGRVCCAGFGVELTRLGVHRLWPAFYRGARRLDRRLHWLHNATVFEFVA